MIGRPEKLQCPKHSACAATQSSSAPAAQVRSSGLKMFGRERIYLLTDAAIVVARRVHVKCPFAPSPVHA